MDIILWLIFVFILAGFYAVLNDILKELRGIRKELQARREERS